MSRTNFYSVTSDLDRTTFWIWENIRVNEIGYKVRSLDGRSPDRSFVLSLVNDLNSKRITEEEAERRLLNA